MENNQSGPAHLLQNNDTTSYVYGVILCIVGSTLQSLGLTMWKVSEKSSYGAEKNLLKPATSMVVTKNFKFSSAFSTAWLINVLVHANPAC
jgi:hypothetical protein